MTSRQPSAPYDFVIRGATIADGTGGPLRDGDVAVSGDVIMKVAKRIAERGADEVDGTDQVLAPGFIDPHTHLDANLFWDPDVTPSSSFGVTTVVIGNCGYGLAPLAPGPAADYVLAALSTVEQIPEEAVRHGVPLDWSDLASYVQRLDKLPVLLNHAFLIGHVPLRAAALGVPGAYSRPAEERELRQLCDLVRRGLALGALGFSTDQVVGNPGPHGTALPGQICGNEELLAIARTLAEGPGPGLLTLANAAMLQGREERLADNRWHERLAETSGRPVVVGPIFDGHDDPGGGLAVVDDLVTRTRPGVTVVPQISTRPFELWTRLDHLGVLVRALPTLRDAIERDGQEGVRRLAADPVGRERLRAEGSAIRPTPVFSGSWDHVHIRYSLHEGVVGQSLSALADERRAHPTDILLDLALADGFKTQVSTAMRNGDDGQLARLVAHPATMIGASDAGAHVLANTDSCYAVWTLQHWVRERQLLSLTEAVRKLTMDQAVLLGLTDRGMVRAGMAADLVLFDPDRIATTGVRYVADQPAGGTRLLTEATGVTLSLVNGMVATRDGRPTGVRPGRRLRPKGA